jgi:Putative Flp pilus-assembly TadE/G-like
VHNVSGAGDVRGDLAQSSVRRFARDNRGNVAIGFGFTAMLLVACVGAAVDYGRWVSANRASQNAVDSAVLAASRVAQTTNDPAKAIVAANEYYAKMRTGIAAKDGIAFVAGALPHEFMVTGQAEVSTPFLSVIGINALPIAPRAAASVTLGGFGDSALELSLMLDLTGSMCADGNGPCTSGTKVDALKASAKDLINIVVADDPAKSAARVALVPFSTRIRVGADGSSAGADLMRKLTDLPPESDTYRRECLRSTGGGGSENSIPWKCLEWAPAVRVKWPVMPCVTDRYSDSQNSYWGATGTDDRQWDLSDDAPGHGKWLNAHDGSRMPLSYDSRDIQATSHLGKVPGDPAENWNYTPDGGCADVAPSNIIMPLSADKAALNARVDGFSFFGSTSGPLATQWSWYMLSPKWKSIWPSASEPAPYSDLAVLSPSGAPKLKKIAVLMTDGVYNSIRGWKVGEQVRMSAYASKVCREMKAQGIIIYTVGFGLNELAPAEQLLATQTLQDCATSHQIQDGSWVYNFYNAQTVAGLQGAFRDIGLQLSNLRLTR